MEKIYLKKDMIEKFLKTKIDVSISYDGRYFTLRLPKKMKELFLLDEEKKYMMRFEVEHPSEGMLPLLEDGTLDYSMIKCSFSIYERKQNEKKESGN